MTIPIKNYFYRSMFIELITHSTVFLLLTVNIILSKLFHFFKTVFQQFKIHRNPRKTSSRLVDWPFLCCLSGEWFSVEFVRVPMFPCR